MKEEEEREKKKKRREKIRKKRKKSPLRPYSYQDEEKKARDEDVEETRQLKHHPASS